MVLRGAWRNNLLPDLELLWALLAALAGLGRGDVAASVCSVVLGGFRWTLGYASRCCI